MNTWNEICYKPIRFYDLGGWFVTAWALGFLGLGLLGVAFDYFWNYLILSVALRWQQISITLNKKLVYIAFATALGLLIDWLYYEFTWGTLVIGDLRVPAAFPRAGTQPALEIATIIIPMLLIGLANLCISRLHLRLNIKSSLVVGWMMGIFTAPWLIVAFVLLHL